MSYYRLPLAYGACAIEVARREDAPATGHQSTNPPMHAQPRISEPKSARSETNWPPLWPRAHVCDLSGPRLGRPRQERQSRSAVDLKSVASTHRKQAAILSFWDDHMDQWKPLQLPLLLGPMQPSPGPRHQGQREVCVGGIGPGWPAAEHAWSRDHTRSHLAAAPPATTALPCF